MLQSLMKTLGLVIGGDDGLPNVWDPLAPPSNHHHEKPQRAMLSDAEQAALEQEFIVELYNAAKSESKVPENEPLLDGQLFYSMIPTRGERWYGWWMSTDHSIARMMYQSYIENNFDSKFMYTKLCGDNTIGSVVCYRDDQVESCIADIILLCKKYNLPITITAAPQLLPDDEGAAEEYKPFVKKME